MSSSYPALLAARLAAGAAGALVFVTGSGIASRLATTVGSATPIGVYVAGSGAGIVLDGATVPSLLDRHPERWPLAWLGLAVNAAVATVISWRAARTDPRDGEDTEAAICRRAQVRPLWRFAAAYTLFATGYITYITFLSAYLAEHRWSAAQTSLT
ncbi:YbfB/YjiJ family MFS transporter [Dactylosporangium roseum]|uniref:YbfB/YjiJ family MFS transporter n=1 Tax=Dactylosporangium roseum TaxID=47989 RepID=A0ABY5Z364_9ACTN|nr:YbfB/YjiJ family MFS transporter [Dactylosporangium roseum]